MNRRQIVTGALRSLAVLGLAGIVPAAARAASPLARTPAQTEGPFYPLSRPAKRHWNLLAAGGAKHPDASLHLSGRVLDTAGRPLTGARVEIWQSDQQGIYDHPRASGYENFDRTFQGFGEFVTADDGSYQFVTQVPVRYSGRPPHIHAKVFAGGDEKLTTQLYIKDHPQNGRDGIFARLLGGDRALLMMDIRPAAGNAHRAANATRFDFVV